MWGVGPALFFALVSTAALAYVYIPVSQSLDVTAWKALLPIAAFFLSGVIIAVVTGQRESARRRAHLAEQEEQDRANELEATFEAMADGVMVYDDEGYILRTNTVARRLFALDSRPKPKFSLRLRRERKSGLEMLDEPGQPPSEKQSPLSPALNGEIFPSASAMDVLLRTQERDQLRMTFSRHPLATSRGGP